MEIRPILSTLLRNKTGPLLVAIQIALSLAILANALHIVNIRQAVAARPSGIADEHSVFQIAVRSMGKSEHNEQIAAQKRQADQLRAVPGVLSVARVSMIPLSRNGSSTSVSASGSKDIPTTDAGMYLTPDSLAHTWGLKLAEGREALPSEIPEFNSQIQDDRPPTVLVTGALAKKLWPGASTYVGKTMYFGSGDDAQRARVIGVVERLQTQRADLTPTAEYAIIMPVRSSGAMPASLFTVRTEPGQRERVMKEAEAAIRTGATTPTLVNTKTMDEVRTERYRADVALSWMLITVSVLLLMITASGIVGMASLWVQQRRKQIGVRRALGARRADILRYFLTENVMITSCGVAVGLMLAVGLNQLLVAKLEMARLPLEYMAGGAAVFFALGIMAVYGPAWRAATISPAMATRSA
ncbi:MAG: FtsX-like permease family protein [Pseudomonadota bacterium]